MQLFNIIHAVIKKFQPQALRKEQF